MQIKYSLHSILRLAVLTLVFCVDSNAFAIFADQHCVNLFGEEPEKLEQSVLRKNKLIESALASSGSFSPDVPKDLTALFGLNLLERLQILDEMPAVKKRFLGLEVSQREEGQPATIIFIDPARLGQN